MATESDRKRFNLERIIEHISVESSSNKSSSSGPLLVDDTSTGSVKLEPMQVDNLLENRDSYIDEEGMEGTNSMSSNSSEDQGLEDEKDDNNDVDESLVPTKISPRCDICGLLHFKSYRCLTIFSAPSYLRKAFDDNAQKLRVCRKCLTSKESCVENVAISSLASYSAPIRQMRIPLGITNDRRTKAFEFVVRDLKHLKNGRRVEENGETYYAVNHCRETVPVRNNGQTSRKTFFQRLNVDDPIEKNMFLKELNLYSTGFIENITTNSSDNMLAEYEEDTHRVEEERQKGTADGIQPASSGPSAARRPPNSKVVYHVASKNVLSNNVAEKKIGEMFDARKGMNHDLVVNTKRAWKPNKKYDDLSKVEKPRMKKGAKHRGLKFAKSFITKEKEKEKVDQGDKTDQPEKIRTCGINCAVCEKHVQKSYSCCTPQTAPEKFKHLFTPGVLRLKICRKCIPYKKVVKLENQVVKKKGGKVNKKRGRKPKTEKLGAIVKAIPLDGTVDQDVVFNSDLSSPVISGGSLTAKPFASVTAPHGHGGAKEIFGGSNNAAAKCDSTPVIPGNMANNDNVMDIMAQSRGNIHLLQSQQSLNVA